MESTINTTNLSRSEIIKERLFECYHNGEVENMQLLEIFIRTGDILGMRSVKLHAETFDISKQAIYKKKTHNLFGHKFIIDNH